jgi:hypothetical protein
MNTHATIDLLLETGCFYVVHAEMSFVRQFCKGGCEDRIRVHEAEESPLLEAVARERLVKPQQAGKGLAGAVVICEFVEIAGL